MSSPGLYFNWVEEVQNEQDLSEFCEAPSGGVFGKRYLQALTPPKTMVTLTAKNVAVGDGGIDWPPMAGVTQTITSPRGSWTGIVTKYSQKGIDGTDRQDLSVTLWVS